MKSTKEYFIQAMVWLKILLVQQTELSSMHMYSDTMLVKYDMYCPLLDCQWQCIAPGSVVWPT